MESNIFFWDFNENTDKKEHNEFDETLNNLNLLTIGQKPNIKYSNNTHL